MSDVQGAAIEATPNRPHPSAGGREVRVTRTIQIDDLTPGELADLFTEFDEYGQCQFFERVWEIAKAWPGAGWCQQSFSIARQASPAAREAIRVLASHLPAEDFAYIAAVQEQSHEA
ncbi:hypothetical protein [Sphingomonas sp. TX0522]|jgi:hypothetical protein|uniref:hypothetical protein n=1 Tax=Sphingomonas sp. TX0522 TaxID=2479205 RepID=UPI0018DF63B1|nr:hypothetical protein [Sphingomonas sp. TX0522]MBI0530888.1 hypothetical protein [Sphingomonas sp. TX0522]